MELMDMKSVVLAGNSNAANPIEVGTDWVFIEIPTEGFRLHVKGRNTGNIVLTVSPGGKLWGLHELEYPDGSFELIFDRIF